ncbi:hypothetical protein AVEN_49829-1 [Araneus ventricosus]|uniref:Uncharacterized protein n=1 Tax=Araneus ventricosus TaxID=182803 RepID=A0A4Y2Q611_ARAVE|nr:hypothetical protein AVEN_49829-1 [Araneus ventricosus]
MKPTSQTIRNQIAERNRLLSIWQASRDPTDESRFNRAQNFRRKLFEIEDQKRFFKLINEVFLDEAPHFETHLKNHQEKIQHHTYLWYTNKAYSNTEKGEEIANRAMPTFDLSKKLIFGEEFSIFRCDFS